MARIDHFLWAAADLQTAVPEFERRTGIRPAGGAAHPGMGTRNALASLGSDIYLEVIAPDPEQTLTGTLGAELAKIATPGIHSFAVRSDDLAESIEIGLAKGLTFSKVVPMTRERPSGEVITWRIAFVIDHGLGSFVPFMIDWGEAPHPARSSVTGCRFDAFEVRHPEAERLAALYRALDLPVVPRAGPARFELRIETPKGRVSVTGPATA